MFESCQQIYPNFRYFATPKPVQLNCGPCPVWGAGFRQNLSSVRMPVVGIVAEVFTSSNIGDGRTRAFCQGER